MATTSLGFSAAMTAASAMNAEGRLQVYVSKFPLVSDTVERSSRLVGSRYVSNSTAHRPPAGRCPGRPSMKRRGSPRELVARRPTSRLVYDAHHELYAPRRAGTHRPTVEDASDLPELSCLGPDV